MKVMIYVALGGLMVTTTVMPSDGCGSGQMCAAVPDEQLHTHEREPGQAKTFEQITAKTTASGSVGTYFSVMK